MAVSRTCDLLGPTVGVLKAISLHTNAGAEHIWEGREERLISNHDVPSVESDKAETPPHPRHVRHLAGSSSRATPTRRFVYSQTHLISMGPTASAVPRGDTGTGKVPARSSQPVH